MANPHDKAEEFAFLVVLPDGKFRGLARKLKYDLWTIAGICQVPPHVCFKGLNRHVNFDYPMFHAWLHCGEKPPTRTLSMFDDPDQESWALVKRGNFKGRKFLVGGNLGGKDPEEWMRWSAIGDMDSFPKQNEFVCMKPDDVIETARKLARVTVVKARRVAGVPLGSLATVIVRTPEKTINSVYFQVIPAGCEYQHLSQNTYEALL